MRRFVFATAIAALALAGPAWAQTTFPTPQGNVIAPGQVPMCFTQVGNYVACGSPGALALPVQVWNTPAFPAYVYPINPSVLAGAATGTTGAVTATITPPAGRLFSLCGFDITAIGGTATIGPITVTNIQGGTLTYFASSSVAGTVLSIRYAPCINTASIGQAVSIATTADGTATAVTVNMWGSYQ
jgi:hypothetical protein